MNIISLTRTEINNNIEESRGEYMRKLICNIDIRERAKKYDIPLWRIALKLHINDGNFSRKLRTELPEDEKVKIMKIIDELAAE